MVEDVVGVVLGLYVHQPVVDGGGVGVADTVGIFVGAEEVDVDALAVAGEGARHLALGASRPSAKVAHRLEAASAIAALRGASVAAAELAELSVSLTPGEAGGQVLRRRQLLAADHHYASGDAERSHAILERLLDQLPAGSERAKVLRRLGEYWREDFEKSGRLLEQAFVEAASDPRLRAEIVMPRVSTALLRHGPAAAVQLARNSARVAEDCGDPVLLAMFLAELSFSESYSARL